MMLIKSLKIATTSLGFISLFLEASPAIASYTIESFGLADTAFTRYEYYSIDFHNQAGQVAGRSGIYDKNTNTDLGQATWTYSNGVTTRIGLYGAEYTDGYGRQFSILNPGDIVPIRARNLGLSFFNEAAQVIGGSYRYDSNTGVPLGRDAWLYSDGVTSKIGFFGAEFTNDDGSQYSTALSINEAGHVLGQSARYKFNSGDDRTGIWLHSNGVTTSIGLAGREYLNFTGKSDPIIADYLYDDLELNEAGQVMGSSKRYDPVTGNYTGKSAWLYSGGSTDRIGLVDAEHTRQHDSYQFSLANSINENGQVMGVSVRFDPDTGSNNGLSMWLHSSGTTNRIGLTDPEHTRSDGYQYSDIPHHPVFNRENDVHTTFTRYAANTALDEMGQVLGYSNRYDRNTGADLGQSAWIYSNSATTRIGLVDAEHTSNTGIQSSDPVSRNLAGQAVGESFRYNNTTGGFLGQSAWIYSNGVTTKIGLFDAVHTAQGELYTEDGRQYSEVVDINEAGQVIGTSDRYRSGTNGVGSSAWIYSNGVTTRIGLTDEAHTHYNNGRQESFFIGTDNLNEAGQVVGYSERYRSNGTLAGRTAWLFDSTLEQTFAIELSAASDGSANSTIEHFGEDGLVLGYYDYYGSSYTDPELRAFAFTVEDGAVDLGLMAEEGLSSVGWGSLAHAYLADDLNQLVGFGFANGAFIKQHVPYNSVVPVPPAVWLFGSGVLILSGVTRKKSGKAINKKCK